MTFVTFNAWYINKFIIIIIRLLFGNFLMKNVKIKDKITHKPLFLYYRNNLLHAKLVFGANRIR